MKKSKFFEKYKNLNKKDLESIILNVLNISKSRFFLMDELSDKYLPEINIKINKIKKGEPIEYIINKAEFYSLEFYVDNNTLIPRNETELLVDETINSIVNINDNKITLIDVGTGSSCIGISIIKNKSKINLCYFIDISQKALKVSKINIKKHNLENKVIQINSNLLEKILQNNKYKLDNNIIITANLPYIKNKNFENMDNSTIKYEPDLALYGGEETGFEIYQNLIFQCQTLKKQNPNTNILLFIEIGFDQYKYSKNYLDKLNLKYKYYKDNLGIFRCIKIGL